MSTCQSGRVGLQRQGPAGSAGGIHQPFALNRQMSDWVSGWNSSLGLHSDLQGVGPWRQVNWELRYDCIHQLSYDLER
jgi:hypothetical protein